MDTEFRAVNKSDIEFSLTITMPLSDWLILKEQLGAVANSEFPSWRIVKVIREMVTYTETHWVQKDE